MHIVTSILRRFLLRHAPVEVEGIGTLCTTRSGAQFLPGQRLDPPRRMPELRVSEAGDALLTEAVAGELGMDFVAADALCREWREEAFALGVQAGMGDHALLLEGVGTICWAEDGAAEFYAAPELLELLNPLPAEPLVVPSAGRRHSRPQPIPESHPRGTGNRGRRAVSTSGRRRVRPKGRNPHNYTVSFLAIGVALGALGYLCYYLWAHTDWLSDFLPR